MELSITLNDDIKKPIYDLELQGGFYNLSIIVNSNMLYKDILLNIDLNELKKQQKEFLNSYFREKTVNRMLDKISFDNIDDIKIFSVNLNPYEDISKYINNNEQLKKYKIVYDKLIDDTKEELYKLSKYFCDISNIYFNIEGNTVPVNFNDLSQTILKIDEMVESIKSYNYSPLEQIMHVYDIVRDKRYCEEDENEHESISRDVTKVLLGNKIVCVGYTLVFNKILNKLGFKTIENKIKYGDFEHHMQSCVYINDSKYNVEGIYFFDLTSDSKEDKNDFLKSYRFFAKTKKQMESLEKTFIGNEVFVYNIEELEDELKKENLNYNCKVTLNNIYNLLGYNCPCENEVLKEDIKKIKKLFNNPISSDNYFKVLSNVRKNENEIDSDKYKFDLEYFYEIMIISDWVNDYKKYLINELIRGNCLDALSVFNIRKRPNLVEFENYLKELINVNYKEKMLIKE